MYPIVKTWYTSRKTSPGTRYFIGRVRREKYTQLTATSTATMPQKMPIAPSPNAVIAM